MGCMAISWILLGTRRLASEDREILSTCSKMEAEECCSLPELGRGAPGTEGEAHERESTGKQTEGVKIMHHPQKHPRSQSLTKATKISGSVYVVYIKLSLFGFIKNCK